ncbi:hypothetical protein U9M73_21405 [Paenibacillus phoenicis]|uniref:DUF4368 domain-containing protein n=1 Tax=Paenibacillus phoenicis TaxID=554117 RepID=A0ABU5PRQ5_9BACL|nr:hypothetical protein [Paenibacillus phoenicis]MEA3572487.1 hypothetical protein [Paenibacillus phoenicis]
MKEAILADIRAMATHLSSESVMEKLEENMEKQRKLQGKQLKSIENQLEKLKKRKKMAHDKHFDGEMSKSEYDEYMLRVNEEIQTLTQQIEEALRKGDDLKMIQEFKESLQRFLAFNDLTPESLHWLIHRIEIKADGSPRIFYRFSHPSASYLLRSINAQHSTCTVCGNISTGVTSTVR